LSDAHERVFKPITDEEAWEAAVAWAEAKAQERETKAASQTDTDESYESDESDESDDFSDMASSPLFAMAGLMSVGAETTYMYSLNDAAAAAAMWRDYAQTDAYECVAAKKALEALDKWFPSPRKYTAATIIQATARGQAVRAWKAQFVDKLAIELPEIYRARYNTRPNEEIDFVEQHLAEQWAVSPKYARAWIKLAEQRRHSNRF
jgi:hypothetical protein